MDVGASRTVRRGYVEVSERSDAGERRLPGVGAHLLRGPDYGTVTVALSPVVLIENEPPAAVA